MASNACFLTCVEMLKQTSESASSCSFSFNKYKLRCRAEAPKSAHQENKRSAGGQERDSLEACFASSLFVPRRTQNSSFLFIFKSRLEWLGRGGLPSPLLRPRCNPSLSCDATLVSKKKLENILGGDDFLHSEWVYCGLN